MKHLIFDIETVKNNVAEKFVNQKDDSEFKLGNVKDPLKIVAKIEEKKQEEVKKAGLHWITGQVVVICTMKTDTGDKKTFKGKNEKTVLKKFFKYLVEECAGYTLIGKNSDGFDRAFLLGRAIVLNTGIPSLLRKYTDITDIEYIFPKGSYERMSAKLKHFGFALGSKFAKSNDGGNVQKMFDEGKMSEIVRYCKQDVKITAEVVKRYFKEFPSDKNPYKPLNQVPKR